MQYKDYLLKKAGDINSILKNCSDDRAAFIFFSDTHWSANRKNSIQCLNFLLEHTPINKVFFGGDAITDSFATKTEAVNSLKSFRESFAFVRNFYCLRGNHDDNSYEQKNSEAILSGEEIRNFLFNTSEVQIVYSQNSFDFYFDCVSEKSRYICLDTSNNVRNNFQENFIYESVMYTPPIYII